MIAFLKGTIEDIYSDHIVLEHQGMGWNVFVTSKFIAAQGVIGSQVKVYTYLNVKEDGMTLFGFSGKDELELFKQLIGVNGIGPKGAMNILSLMTVDELRIAILSEDSKAIAKAPGVGAKTASRIILDLKDKIDIDTALASPVTNETQEFGDLKNEAVEALIALGYSPSQALGSIKKLSLTEQDTVESIIKQALKSLI
jgi:Holliday junction DNA helicase RuvA